MIWKILKKWLKLGTNRQNTTPTTLTNQALI